MHKIPRIVNYGCPFVWVNGYKVYRKDIHHLDLGCWENLLDSLKMTLKGIHEGENYSLMSCVMYDHKLGTKGAELGLNSNNLAEMVGSPADYIDDIICERKTPTADEICEIELRLDFEITKNA